MPFIATPNGVRVTFEATQNGVPVVNGYHVDAGTSPTVEILQDITDIFHQWWVDDVRGGLHESYVLEAIVATDISEEDGIQTVTTYITDNTGVVTGDPMAANAALVMSWRTAQTGRSFRGRTYVGGLPQAPLTDAQHVDISYAGGFVTAGVNLIEVLETAGYVLSVLSTIANGVQRVAGLLTQILSVVVDTKIDSQRRRTAN